MPDQIAAIHGWSRFFAEQERPVRGVLTAEAMAILQTIAAHEGAPSGVIGEEAGLTRQRASEVIADLERSGLITLRTDPDDRRLRIPVVTRRGTAVLDKLSRARNELWATHAQKVRADLRTKPNHTKEN